MFTQTLKIDYFENVHPNTPNQMKQNNVFMSKVPKNGQTVYAARRFIANKYSKKNKLELNF